MYSHNDVVPVLNVVNMLHMLMRRHSEARDTIRISALFCILLVKHIIAAKVKRIPGTTHPCNIENMDCRHCHSS
jgi:hypothetical protein